MHLTTETQRHGVSQMILDFRLGNTNKYARLGCISRKGRKVKIPEGRKMIKKEGGGLCETLSLCG